MGFALASPDNYVPDFSDVLLALFHQTSFSGITHENKMHLRQNMS